MITGVRLALAVDAAISLGTGTRIGLWISLGCSVLGLMLATVEEVAG